MALALSAISQTIKIGEAKSAPRRIHPPSGYRRSVGLEAAATFGRSRRFAYLFILLFDPYFKLASKTRDGAKVTEALLPAGDTVSAAAGRSPYRQNCRLYDALSSDLDLPGCRCCARSCRFRPTGLLRLPISQQIHDGVGRVPDTGAVPRRSADVIAEGEVSRQNVGRRKSANIGADALTRS